jgi:hypothetical protein
MFLRYYLADKDDVVTVYPVKEFKVLITETVQAELPTNTEQYMFNSLHLEVEIKATSTRSGKC